MRDDSKAFPQWEAARQTNYVKGPSVSSKSSMSSVVPTDTIPTVLIAGTLIFLRFTPAK